MNNLDNVIELLSDLSLSELEEVRDLLDQLIVVLEALEVWANSPESSNNGWGVDCSPTELKIMLDDCLGLPILVTKDCLNIC